MRCASALLCLSLALFFPPGPLSAEEAVFPWICRKEPESPATPAQTPRKELRGEWISSLEPSRVLDIREGNFSLQGTGRNLAGTVSESEPWLILQPEGGSPCVLLWQLLGDGRLSFNSGEDLFHRRGEPAVPTTTVRRFGSPDCPFTVTVPSVLPLEEIEDGVRIYTVERDGAMQILSGTTDKSVRDFVQSLVRGMGASDYREVSAEDRGMTFSVTVQGVPMLQHVIKDERQYLHISLMGDYSGLVGYLRHVRILPPGADQ